MIFVIRRPQKSESKFESYDGDQRDYLMSKNVDFPQNKHIHDMFMIN